MKLDEITEVIVPDPGQEAARDLVRAREDTRGDLVRARHRVSKLLLRQGIHYSGGDTWTQAHMSWLYRQRFDSAPLQLTYDLALETVTETLGRRDRLDGNTHARRLLIEAAWHHRRPYTHPSVLMRSRWEAATPTTRARGQAGNRRLHDRWLVYLEHRKRPVVANVAIARELAGWCWSLASDAQTTAAQPRR